MSPGGSGTINDTPVNSTNTTAVIIYNITPSVAGCQGVAVNYVVTVRPVPDVAASDQTICSAETTNIPITNPNGVTGTTYAWTVTSIDKVSGANFGSGNVISQQLTNTDGVVDGTVTYEIIPSAKWLPRCANHGYGHRETETGNNECGDVPRSTNLQWRVAELSYPTSTIPGTTFDWTTTLTGPIDALLSRRSDQAVSPTRL
ncbi:MAG: hypothetical protein HC859_17530 [Bacteroidia bacterium]|nr:hypothetical protein [Bacteroidia bacterium]